MTMALVELNGVTKAYYTDRSGRQARVVLKDVSLHIESGEFVCLIGPSGCGKSVTLNLIAGFERPTLGSLRFKGAEIDGPSPDRGVVFQEYSLLPWLTVKENITYALKSRKVPKCERATGADDALASVGLAEFASQRPNLLSGGMKQRVAIARLLAIDSEMFLMDEPFSALDEQTRSKLDESLIDLWRKKRKTIVFVTHNISEAILLGSRIVLYSGTPGSIVKQWSLADSMPRDMANPEARALRDEILQLMPVTAYADEACVAQ